MNYIVSAVRRLAQGLGLHLIPRQHRSKVHTAILSVIALDLLHSGAKVADLGFLVLSLMIEAEEWKVD